MSAEEGQQLGDDDRVANARNEVAFQGNDRDPSRLETFSDGVMAIAITILVLDLTVPNRDALDGESLWSALRHMWPSYLAYALSFFIIGIIWANHHAIFKHIQRVDHYLLLLNLSALFVVGLFPFATALLSEYLGHDGQRLAAAIYTGCNLAAACCFYALWSHARRHHLLSPDTDPVTVDRITKRFRVGPVIYLAAFVLALVYPPAGLALLALLSIFYFLPESVRVFGY